MYSLAVTLATAGHKTSLLEKRGDSATIALGQHTPPLLSPYHCTLGKSLNRNSREQSYLKW